MLVEINNRYVDLINQHKTNLEVTKDTDKTVKKAQIKIGELELELSHANKKIDQLLLQKKKVEEALSEE